MLASYLNQTLSSCNQSYFSGLYLLWEHFRTRHFTDIQRLAFQKNNVNLGQGRGGVGDMFLKKMPLNVSF